MFNESIQGIGEAVRYVLSAVSAAREQLPEDSHIVVPDAGTIFVYSSATVPGTNRPVRVECWMIDKPGRVWVATTCNPMWFIEGIA